MHTPFGASPKQLRKLAVSQEKQKKFDGNKEKKNEKNLLRRLAFCQEVAAPYASSKRMILKKLHVDPMNIVVKRSRIFVW